MEDNLIRAQHYRDLAAQMERTATGERNEAVKAEFLKLAAQYGRLADKLLEAHVAVR
jgi:hypothetical protein